MVPTRLCTKSCPNTVWSLLQTGAEADQHPLARTQELWGCCPPWRAQTREQSWLEGAEAGRHRDKCGVADGREEHHIAAGRSCPIPGHAAGAKRVRDGGGAVLRPQFSRVQRLTSSHRSPLMGLQFPLLALQGDACSADAAHKPEKSQAKSTKGAWPIPPLRAHPSSSARSRWMSGKQHPVLVPQDLPCNNTRSW